MSEYEGKVPYRKYTRNVDLSDILYYEATGRIMKHDEKEKVRQLMEDKKLYAISFVDDGGIRSLMGRDDKGHTVALKIEYYQDILNQPDLYLYIGIFNSAKQAEQGFNTFTKPSDYEFEVIEVEEIIKPVVVGYKIKE